MASQLVLNQHTLLAVLREYVDANHQDLLHIIIIILDEIKYIYTHTLSRSSRS